MGKKTTSEVRRGKIVDTTAETLADRLARLSILYDLIASHEDRNPVAAIFPPTLLQRESRWHFLANANLACRSDLRAILDSVAPEQVIAVALELLPKVMKREQSDARAA